jgi:uncharacterized membrane protein
VDPLVFGLVAGAAVLHVAWNVLLKTAGDPLKAAAIGMTSAAAVIVPAAAIGWVVTGQQAIPPEAIGLSVISGALEAAYFAFLAAAYRRGDLSVVYPIARGTAPLLAVAVGIGVLGERLGGAGIAGVGLLLIGLLTLQRPWQFLRPASRGSGSGDPAIPFALATGVMIAGYSAVDRVGSRLVEPWFYAGLIWASCMILLWAYVWFRRTVLRAPDEAAPFDPRRAAIGGWITLAAYLLILVAFSVAPLTAVAPLRESAIVLASGWGTMRLGEGRERRETIRRIAASALVVAGAIFLAIDG